MARDPIQTLDIVKVWEYLGGGLPNTLVPSRWNFGQCALHGGDSGRIYPDINKFHCFGCGEHGDGYDLLRIKEGIGLAAAQELGEQMGWFVDSGPVRGPARKPPPGARPNRPDRDRGRKKPQRERW